MDGGVEAWRPGLDELWRLRDAGRDKEVDPEIIERFLEFLDDPGNQPVLVHCKRGAERTGTLIAVYRIERDGWTPTRAYAEMQEYGFRSFWFGNLKRFVLEYEPSADTTEASR